MRPRLVRIAMALGNGMTFCARSAKSAGKDCGELLLRRPRRVNPLSWQELFRRSVGF